MQRWTVELKSFLAKEHVVLCELRITSQVYYMSPMSMSILRGSSH